MDLIHVDCINGSRWACCGLGRSLTHSYARPCRTPATPICNWRQRPRNAIGSDRHKFFLLRAGFSKSVSYIFPPFLSLEISLKFWSLCLLFWRKPVRISSGTQIGLKSSCYSLFPAGKIRNIKSYLKMVYDVIFQILSGLLCVNI